MTLRVLAVDVTGAEVSTGPSPAGAPSQPVPGGDEVCDCHRMAALVASKIRSPSGPSLTAHGFERSPVFAARGEQRNRLRS